MAQFAALVFYDLDRRFNEQGPLRKRVLFPVRRLYLNPKGRHCFESLGDGNLMPGERTKALRREKASGRLN